MPVITSDSKADPAYEDVEKTSSTGTLKGDPPSPPIKAFDFPTVETDTVVQSSGTAPPSTTR